jgi:Second Messenger Oligonucleotide or Dinucleotide Synthetase domain
MFQSGSFSHGTGVKGNSDVDYFASLKSSRPTLSSSILSSVRAKLKERFPFTNVRVSRPAVVIEFGSGYETYEVIPAFAVGSVGGGMKFYIPGVVDEWMESTPEAHLEFVNDCNKIPGEGYAKSFVRLVKAWKYYCNVPISSFYLEMRAAKYISEQKTVIYAHDICYFLQRLFDGGLADMNDPTGSTGRIRPCSSDATKREALSKLSTAVTRARKALDAHVADDDATAFRYWDLLFAGKFPAYY